MIDFGGRPFDLTLSSNVSSSLENKPCHYVTKLKRPIELEGAWEVAIADITYPHTWNTLFRDCRLWFRVWRINPKMKEYVEKSSQLASARSTLSTLESSLAPAKNDMDEKKKRVDAADREFAVAFSAVNRLETLSETSTDDEKAAYALTKSTLDQAVTLRTENRRVSNEEFNTSKVYYEKLSEQKTLKEKEVQEAVKIVEELRTRLISERIITPTTDTNNIGIDSYATFLTRELTKVANSEFTIVREGLVPKGYYQSPQDIAKRVCTEFQSVVEGTSFSHARLNYAYDDVQRRGRFFVANGFEVEMITPDRYLFGELLGFSEQKAIQEISPPGVGTTLDAYIYAQRVSSRHIPKLDVPSIMWIYTDIIREQYVGNEKVQLLNKCPVQGAYGSQAFWAFHNLRFHQLTVTNISEITIKIVSGTSKEPILIEDGEVVVTLQFQRTGYI